MTETPGEKWKEENAAAVKGQSLSLESDGSGSHQQQNLMDNSSVPMATVSEGPLVRLWENFKTQIKCNNFINQNDFFAERENVSSGQRKLRR